MIDVVPFPDYPPARFQALLSAGPPVLGANLACMLVAVAHNLVREPRGPALELIALLTMAGASAVGIAVSRAGAGPVGPGGPARYPRLWRAAPWTAAGGFLLGLIAAGAHALSK